MRATSRTVAFAALLLSAACGKPDRPAAAACGIASLAGPTLLLSEFAVAGQTLAAPPDRLPEQIAVRVVAGPVYRGIVGRADSVVIVGVEGTPPEGTTPGFGTLIVDKAGTVRGVLLYEGAPVENAPVLGTVSMGSLSLPLIGIQLDPARIEDPRCPFFPDSIIR
jgi:hypothetical protein